MSEITQFLPLIVCTIAMMIFWAFDVLVVRQKLVSAQSKVDSIEMYSRFDRIPYLLKAMLKQRVRWSKRLHLLSPLVIFIYLMVGITLDMDLEQIPVFIVVFVFYAIVAIGDMGFASRISGGDYGSSIFEAQQMIEFIYKNKHLVQESKQESDMVKTIESMVEEILNE